MVAVHKGAVGRMHRLLGESAPSSLGMRETSFGQEDAQSFALEAAAALSRALAGVRSVLAAELLALVQADRLSPIRSDGAPAGDHGQTPCSRLPAPSSRPGWRTEPTARIWQP